MGLTEGKTKFYVASHALIEKEGKYLATKRHESENYAPLKWDIPGGTIDPGETAEEALLREVKEETGLEVKIKDLLFIFTNLDNMPDWHVIQIVFLCEYISGQIQLIPNEHSKWQWLTKDEIKKLDAISFLKKLSESESFNKL